MLSSFSDFRTRLKSRLHARARAKHVYMYVHTYTYVAWPRRYLQHRCSSSSLQGARSTARSSRRSNNPPPWRRCRNVPPNARLDGRLALSQKLQDSKHRRVLLLPLLQLCLSFSLYFSIYFSLPSLLRQSFPFDIRHPGLLPRGPLRYSPCPFVRLLLSTIGMTPPVSTFQGQ